MDNEPKELNRGIYHDTPTYEDGGRVKESKQVTNPVQQHHNAPTILDIISIAKGGGSVRQLFLKAAHDRHIIVNETEDGAGLEIGLDKLFEEAVVLQSADHHVDENGIITFEVDEFAKNTIIEVLFEIETSGAHFGSSIKVFPKDDDICVSTGVITANGSTLNYYATNNDGLIAISFDSQIVASTDYVEVSYRVLL